MAGVRAWRRQAKHFRRKRRERVQVPGLGAVWHVLLRYEAGDGLLGKPKGPVESWDEDLLCWSDRLGVNPAIGQP